MDALEFLLDFYNSMQLLTLTEKHRFIRDQLYTDCLFNVMCHYLFFFFFFLIKSKYFII